MTRKDTISIMPDYGMAPYAWLRKAGQARGVGGCISDSVCGFPDEFGVSRGLQKSFERWACYFECNVKPGREKDFDWESFHLRGRQLTKRWAYQKICVNSICPPIPTSAKFLITGNLGG